MKAIRWSARATLLRSDVPLSEHALAMRSMAPALRIDQGSLEEMIGRVTELPVSEHWRFAIASDGAPLLRGEEITALGARIGEPNGV